MHKHAREHTRAKRAGDRARLVYARSNTRVKQTHIQNTLEQQRDPRIHRYPPPRAIKTRRRRSTLHSARAPAHRARSGAPAMSPRHRTIVPGVLSRRAPSHRCARGRHRRGAAIRPAAVATHEHAHEHTHAGRRAHTHAHEHVPTTDSPTSLGDGYGERRSRARPGAAGGAAAGTQHTSNRGHVT